MDVEKFASKKKTRYARTSGRRTAENFISAAKFDHFWPSCSRLSLPVWRLGLERIPNDVSMNIRQAVLTTLVAVRKTFVIDATQVQDGCLDVVYMHRRIGDVPSKIVRRADNVPPLDTATRHPP